MSGGRYGARSTAAASQGLPGEWTDDAACRGRRTAVFFPTDDSTAGAAKALCRRCPVVEQCLEFALATHQDAGVWGGLSEGERRRLRRSVA